VKLSNIMTTMDNFEILPTDNELVKKVVYKKHRFEALVYYVSELPPHIPDEYVYAFGYLNKSLPDKGKEVIVVFAMPSHAEIDIVQEAKHALVLNAMHHYVSKEWNKFWFDSVAYSKGYQRYMFNEKVDKEHDLYLERGEKELALMSHEWRNKHLLN